MKGGADSDTIEGGTGRDFLYGGTGADVLDGGIGNDRLWGDDGADEFHFTGAWGYDRVQDFEDGIDLINLASVASVTSFADLAGGAMVQVGAGVEITLTEGSIHLRNTLLAEFDATDFVF